MYDETRTWASFPIAILRDVDFARWMVEVVGLETRKNRYRVFQVVDMSDVEVSVDVVSKVLVSNLSTNISAKGQFERRAMDLLEGGHTAPT